MGKPASYKNLALEQRKAAKRARKQARRKSKRTADVILAGADFRVTCAKVLLREFARQIAFYR